MQSREHSELVIHIADKGARELTDYQNDPVMKWLINDLFDFESVKKSVFLTYNSTFSYTKL